MFAEDYMTPDPHTIAPTAHVPDAEALMQSHGIRHLPVLDENSRLTGMISDRDVRSAIGYDQSLGARLTVAEVMTPDPTTIPAKASLEEALRIFCSNRYGALPVMRNAQVVGMLSRSDLLWAFYGVLGLDAAGQRIEVALPNGWQDLALAFKALADCPAEVVSAIVTRTRRDGEEPALHLRVAGDDAPAVERLLRDASLIVLEPEHT